MEVFFPKAPAAHKEITWPDFPPLQQDGESFFSLGALYKKNSNTHLQLL